MPYPFNARPCPELCDDCNRPCNKEASHTENMSPRVREHKCAAHQ